MSESEDRKTQQGMPAVSPRQSDSIGELPTPKGADNAAGGAESPVAESSNLEGAQGVGAGQMQSQPYSENGSVGAEVQGGQGAIGSVGAEVQGGQGAIAQAGAVPFSGSAQAYGQAGGAVQVPVAPNQTYEQDGQPQDFQQNTQPKNEEEIATLSGKFVMISLWRAFRLRIHAHEILQSERKTLAEEAPHVVDPEHQAFLAWRRSVLLLAAICFVPLTIIRLFEAFEGPAIPTFARVFLLLPVIAEAIFCAIAFDQLKNWTRWEKQRRILAIAWALYMLAPFVVYLYPFRTAFDGSIRAIRQAAEFGDVSFRINRDTAEIVLGLVFGVQAQLVLAPKLISLMPGIIRASIVSKLLFPGMTAPGWLMLIAAPFYALIAYMLLLLPYQITGHWYFVAGNAGVLTAQLFIAWSGRILTIPLDAEDANRRIHRSWMAYTGIMALAGLFMILGLHDFLTQLNLSLIRIVSAVLSMSASVLLLTLVGTDLIVGGMAYFRKRVQPDPERERILQASSDKLNRFSS